MIERGSILALRRRGVAHVRNICVLVLFSLARGAGGEDIRFVSKPAPKPEEGKVLITTYSVDWALRDDDKPSLGSLETFYSRPAAELRARRALQSNREAHKGEKAWTWIKYVEITATPELVSKDDPVLGRVRVWHAIDAALSKKVAKCNFLVQEAADAAKIGGLSGLTADKMAEYFGSEAGRKAGWVKLAAVPKSATSDGESLLEVANRRAREGSLVIGVITTADRNSAKPNGTDNFSNGHVVVITPSGGSDWDGTLVASANAGKEKIGRLVPANEITLPWERPKYQFFAIPVAEER
jgi:hypothetical protein